MKDLARIQKQIYRSVTSTGTEKINTASAKGRLIPLTETEARKGIANVVTPELIALKLQEGEAEITVKKRPVIGIVLYKESLKDLSCSLTHLLHSVGAEVREYIYDSPSEATFSKFEHLDGLIIVSERKQAVADILASREAKLFFEGLKMEPGAEMMAAVSQKKPVVVLPEDSYQAMVCCQAFFLQAVKNMHVGLKRAVSLLSGEFKDELDNSDARYHLVPVDLTLLDGVLQAWPLEKNLEGLAKAKGMVFVNYQQEKLDNFSIVKIMPLAGFNNLFL